MQRDFIARAANGKGQPRSTVSRFSKIEEMREKSCPWPIKGLRFP